MGLSSSRARASASSPHAYQSTGLSACCRRYGLVSSASRFTLILCPVSSLPSGTVTFLFTDIEGSTALLKTLGDGYADVLRQQRTILRETLGGAGGSEIDTQGDAFFFSFVRAREAVAGAVSAQRALADHEWPKGAGVKVRMGLHTGEPSVGDERIFQLAREGADTFAPLKAERRPPSGADILGEDFEERIQDLVEKSLAGSLRLGER